MYSIETNNLSHRFSGNVPVLNDICLRVPRGSIYGFLGPNGAGKTTTLRLLLGLLTRQEGDIVVFGRSFAQHRIEILKQVGSMIESPSLYGHLNARENLLLLQKIYRCPVERISEVLLTVGLADTGKKKVSQFSLGMKQRLSIAVSLLHNPSLLILDEPTNGLDPYGIIEIRDLLKKLNEEQGVTIVISSHLLAEIEKLVSHVGIISKGRMVFQGTLAELTQKQFSSSSTVIHCSDTAKAANIIRTVRPDFISNDEKISMPVLSPAEAALLNKLLVTNDIDVSEIATTRKDLETIFMDLINQS